MGMAAVPMPTQRIERGATAVDLERMGIWRLRDLACQQHSQHVDEAARVFVRRVLDMEVERRMLHSHDNLGWHTHSPLAPGLAPGSTDVVREPLAAAYARGIRLHEDHDAARRWIVAARLSPRKLLAALIQARKLDRRVRSGTQEDVHWGANYDAIARAIKPFAQQLGFSVSGYVVDCIEQVEDGQHPGRVLERRTPRLVAAYRDGKAITNAATQAKAELILLAKAGVL